MKTQLFLTLIISLTTLTACTPFMAMTSDGSVVENYGERTFGTTIEDNSIESKAAINIPRADPELENAHIRPHSYNRVLLITGQVSSKQLKKTVTATAEKIRHVRRVHNELEVIKPITFLDRSKDSFLKTKIKSRLIATEGVDSGRIVVIVENAKVYLMGLVTQDEADRVVKAVQQVAGLQKIVRAFEYINAEADI